MPRILGLFLIGYGLFAGWIVPAPAQEAHHRHHAGPAVLTEAGTDPFATIQEVIRKLESDPSTDWSRVNLEALRRHLVDMHQMTLYVTVKSQTPIPGGAEFVVEPQNDQARAALERVFAAHPAQLKAEYGWDMSVAREKNGFVVRVTGPEKDAAKILGLGYIGILAVGEHHQHHHWMLATGRNPHH